MISANCKSEVRKLFQHCKMTLNKLPLLCKFAENRQSYCYNLNDLVSASISQNLQTFVLWMWRLQNWVVEKKRENWSTSLEFSFLVEKIVSINIVIFLIRQCYYIPRVFHFHFSPHGPCEMWPGCFRCRRRRTPWTCSLSMPSSFAPSMRHFLWRLRPPSRSWTASATTRTGVRPTSPWRRAWESVLNITMSRGKTGSADFHLVSCFLYLFSRVQNDFFKFPCSPTVQKIFI